MRLLCVLIGQVALPRFLMAQEMTGEDFCEGGRTFLRTDQAACRAQECCQWEDDSGMCWSAVGDALCSPDTGPAGFSVGDEVIVGDVAYDERACITRVNSDGSYQIDYRDGSTSDERAELEDMTAAVSHLRNDCRHPGEPPAPAILSVESSSDATGSPIDCATYTADQNYDNACHIPDGLLDDEDPQRLGCTEWQTVSNFVFEGGNQNTCGVDGCSPCSYQPGDGSESAGGVSHLPVSFSPALMNVYKIQVTFNSLVDDGNEDVIFKELAVTDTLRYDCQAISCKGCAPFDPTCNPELVDVEAAECLQPEVIISRTASGDPIGCIGATVDGLHEAYCVVDDEDLPATVVYDLGRAETLEQIVLLSDWWAKRPDGGQLEVCDTDHWIGGDEECEATPLEQCLAECDEDGKGLYEDPLEVGNQTPACATGCAFYFLYTDQNLQTCTDWCTTADVPSAGLGAGGCEFELPIPDAPVLRMCAACAEPGWPSGCPSPGDCAAACQTAAEIEPCSTLPNDGCSAWRTINFVGVSGFQFDNNDQQVCELDGCGHCCYERGDNCEAPEAGISHMPLLFEPPLEDIEGVRLTFDSVVTDGNDQVIFREIHFLSSEMYTCGVLQYDNDGSPVAPPPTLGCTDRYADNFDPLASEDDDSCLYPGCTDSRADNFDPDTNMDDGSCIIAMSCENALETLSTAIESECCDVAGCNSAVPTACSARCAEMWMPFSIVCSSIVEAQGEVWSEFNAMCEATYYPASHFGGLGVRCDLAAEWTSVSQVCDCGLSGCNGYVTPATCSLECANGFEAFMSKCHNEAQSLPDSTSNSLNTFLASCQGQYGYIQHSMEWGGGH